MRISFFLGRNHHALKLLPIVNAGIGTELFEADFLIADNAVNIDPATEFLMDYGISEYHHVKTYVTAVNEKSVAQVVRQVFRPELVETVPPFWLAFSAREAVECINGFKGYLDQRNPDAVFVLHGQNFWTKMLLYLASELGKPTYSIQEGIILDSEERDLSKYTGALDYVSKLFSWSEYDRPYYADPERVIPVGPTHLDEWIRLFQDPREKLISRNALSMSLGMAPMIRRVLFAPPIANLYRGNLEEDFRELCKWSIRSGYDIIARFHPFQGNISVLDRIIDIYPNVKKWDADDAMRALVMSDILITQTSTISFEALSLGIPVLEIDRGYNGLMQPLWRQGGAFLLDGDFDLINRVLDGKVDLTEMKNFKERRLPLADGQSVQRVMAEIKNDYIHNSSLRSD